MYICLDNRNTVIPFEASCWWVFFVAVHISIGVLMQYDLRLVYDFVVTGLSRFLFVECYCGVHAKLILNVP